LTIVPEAYFFKAKAMAKMLEPDDLDEPELRVLKAEKYFSDLDTHSNH
jgi:hypothetical protein